jgi:hypothetical protein
MCGAAGRLAYRMGDEEEYHCTRCDHAWIEMDDPDGEFTGWL